MTTEVEGEVVGVAGDLVVVPGPEPSLNAVAQSSREEARARADEIREHLTLGFAKLAIARERRDDVALGYPSWWLYVETEFGDLRYLGLPPEERRHVVESMRSADKMSQRAIAERLDVALGTVNNDLRLLGEQTGTVVGRDGKEYGPTRREAGFVPVEGMSKRAEVVARIRHAGERGLTCRELELATGWHHGKASSPLSAVAGQGKVAPSGNRRLGYRVYVAPESAVAEGVATHSTQRFIGSPARSHAGSG